jgi:hypothetical protein
MDKNRILDNLTAVLGDTGGNLVFPCIQDLVVNGLQLSRLSAFDVVPNRQDVTQYLAAWCRFVGLNENTCREWLSDYAVAILSSISKTSPSGIRHSTKSNVRYIYRDEVTFTCGREGNQFRARCNYVCPVYAEMGRKPTKAKGGKVSTSPSDASPEDSATLPAVQVKQIYRDQFEAAMELVLRELEKGAKKTRIVEVLTQRGMKTRTGRKWTYAILCTEIRKLKGMYQSESPDSDFRTSG